MSNRHEDGVHCSFAVSDSCPPGFATVSHQQADISRVFDLLMALLFDLLFSEPIDVEESFPNPHSRHINKDS